MAARGKTYWSSEPVNGSAGKFRVVVLRLAPGQHSLGRRDLYSATLYCKGEAGDEAVETDFWQQTAPPHDSDKLAFREKARRAAQTDAGDAATAQTSDQSSQSPS